MHYLGFVIVSEPTETAVAEALAPFKDQEWDWYRCGGRWDGYLQGETPRYNFEDIHDQVARNSYRVRDLPALIPYFVVFDGKWLSRKKWDYRAHTFVEVSEYHDKVRDALAERHDDYVVLVDAHNRVPGP